MSAAGSCWSIAIRLRPLGRQVAGRQPAPGLAECLRAEKQGVRRRASLGGAANLWVLSGGRAPQQPGGPLRFGRLATVVKELAAAYGLVVFDMPAATQASCVAHLARLLDGVLLVLEAGRVRWDSAQHVKELFLATGTRLLGAVLNKQSNSTPIGSIAIPPMHRAARMTFESVPVAERPISHPAA